MSKNSFVPRTNVAIAFWLKNLANKLPGYIAKYGLVAADATDIQKGSDFFSWIMDSRNLITENTSKWTTYGDEMRDGIEPGAVASAAPVAPALAVMPALVAPGIMTRAVSIAHRIKKHSAYTKADGDDLGLEGTEIVVDTLNAKPVIKVRANAGRPEIVWTKNNMTSIEIHVDRSGIGNNYSFLAIDAVPNYIDTAQPPALADSHIWKYKAIYRLKDERVGHWSDEVSVVAVQS